MVKTKHIILVVGILAGGILAVLIFLRSEEAKIKRQFEFVAENIKKKDGENPIISITKAKLIREVLAERCQIDAPAYSAPRDIPSDELPAIVLRVRSEFSEIILLFHDFDIEFPEQDTARVSVTAIMEGKLTSGEPVEEFHELKCSLQKIEGDWRFREIGVVEVLKK